MTDPLLSTSDITVRFGGVVAADAISVSVAPGETLGIVGPNGSGKSTLLNAISGLVPATGKLMIGGQEIALGHPQRIRRAGVLRAFQTPQCFDELTVLENALLALPDRRHTGLVGACMLRPAMLGRERERWQRAMRVLEQVGLDDLSDVYGRSLTYGQRRRLELARCLAGEPRVMLLDEPSAGLNESETRAFGDLLAELRSPDIGLVIVDHKIQFLNRLCDRIVVLELGRVIAEGPPSQIWHDPRVVAAYLGGGSHA